ncbi:MAG: T9SS type A sorting domain-containing protein [Saprospiraceae bacterium]
MSSTISKLFSICSFLLLIGISEMNAQQDCNATSVSMSCNSMVNLSLGVACTQQVQPQEMLTTNSFSCYNNFTVSILNTNLGSTVGPAQIGKTYDVKVTHTISGNSCWGKIKVEDKTAPIIACSTVTTPISCADPDFKISYGTTVAFDNIAGNSIPDVNLTVANRPTVTENCNGYTLYYSDMVQNFDCTTSQGGLMAIVTRTWKAVDAQGNTRVCSENYEILPTPLSSIQIPADLTLDCADTYALDQAGNPAPSFTGFPTLNGVPINGSNVNLCQIATSYSDLKTAGSCAGFTIVRKWTLTNWCEPNMYGNASPITIQVNQLINVKDIKKPIFLGWNNTATLTTDNNSCFRSIYAPIPPQTIDNCDTQLDFSYELSDQMGVTLITKGTVLKNIQRGIYTLRAYATDDCGNTASTSTTIEIKDLIPPVAACDQNTRVSLRTDGTAVVNATTFNNGSFDNCCIDTSLFQVKRMSEDDSKFNKFMKFTCADAGIQVVLRVFDCSGNSNTCMVNTVIEDKISPVIFVEDSVDPLKCGGEISARKWLDEHKPELKTVGDYPTPTNPGYYDNCSAKATYQDLVGIDQCSRGTIKRVWTVTDDNGNTGTAIQTVTIDNQSSYTVSYPKDVTFNCEQATINLSPSVLGTPTITQAANSCAIISTTYEDRPVGTGTCRKINRVWKVLNMCANSMSPAPNQFETGTQVISIIDNVAPVIGNVEITTTYEAKQCFATSVELKKTGFTDNCSQNITVTYTSNIPNYEAGFLPATLTNVASGNYKLTYRASDNCGNFTTKNVDLTVRDDKKPVAICHDNLAVSLGNIGQGMILARQVDGGSSDNCTEKSKLKYRIQVPAPARGTAYDASKTDSMYIFRCPTTGIDDSSYVRVYPVALWVGDESGNWDFCETVVSVQDNMKICPPVTSILRNVAGIIATNDNKPVENVQLKLKGATELNAKSDASGSFIFNNVSSGSYDLIPEKNEFPLNGVSTFDLIMMTKHILGVQQFSSSNQFIAADINANGVISTADVVELRKMILGLQSGFSKNQSWRFVEKGVNYSTNNISSWLANLPNKKQFLNLDNPKADFTAIKIGDLNMNAKPNSSMAGNGRNAKTTNFDVNQQTAEAGEIVKVTFSSADYQSLEGHQLALNYDKNVLELMQIHGDQDAFAFLEEGLITHSQIGKANNNEEMFSLTFKARQQVDFSTAIRLNEEVMNAEAYITKGEATNIDLKFKTVKSSNGIELFQNQPNPFRGTTVIGFQLPETQHVKLSIFDVRGLIIKTYEGDYQPGYQQIVIDSNELNGNGVFVYRLEAGNQSITRKMVIIE